MLVAIVGATGTGKSQLSLDLAASLAQKGIPVEIVNADAMQLYRGMDIGTNKLTVDERHEIPHHLLDVLDPSEEASVARYQVEARQCIEEIEARGAWPVLVGGSGLYVSAVLYDFRFPGTDPVVRAALEERLDREGPGILFEELQRADPVAAESVGPANGRRIVRALEVIELTGEPFGAGLGAEQRPWRVHRSLFVQEDRSVLVERLDRRVEKMWGAGIVAEVGGIGPSGFGSTASRAIGYAQALAQLAGTMSETEAIAQAQALTRRYARRQQSWFGRYRDAERLAAGESQLVQRATAAVAAP